MQALYGMAGVAHRARQAIGAVLGAREHQDVARVALDQREQQRGFVRVLHEIHILNGAAGWYRLPTDRDTERITQMHPRQGTEVRRERCGEQQRLPWRWQHPQDAVELWFEAHVEHPIGFVKYQDAHVAQRHRAALEVVDQAPRCRDDDRRTAAQLRELRAVRNTTNNERRMQTRAQAPGPAVRLLSQLTGRRQHQGGRVTGGETCGTQALDYGNEERGRFAGPRLRCANHIAPG